MTGGASDGVDRLFVVGGALFVAGSLAIIAAFIPLATGGDPLPSVFWWLSMLAPLGVACVLWGLVRRARARSRQARQR
jgi:hypothetical protein